MRWASSSKHVILIRDPVKLISSWAGPTSPNNLEMSLEEVPKTKSMALIVVLFESLCLVSIWLTKLFLSTCVAHVVGGDPDWRGVVAVTHGNPSKRCRRRQRGSGGC
jgi:hypothetical protein